MNAHSRLGGASEEEPRLLALWEELATFYNNLAFFFLEKGDKETARQQNHAALDTIEDLATPAPSMEDQRAKAHMLHLYLGPSQHTEFHELYKHLGDEYVSLAKEYFNSDQPDTVRSFLEELNMVNMMSVAERVLGYATPNLANHVLNHLRHFGMRWLRWISQGTRPTSP